MLIFTYDIDMEYGIDKCAILVLKRRKIRKFDEMSLPDGRVMKELNEGVGYKYLRILQADQIPYTKMKEKGQAKCFRKVCRVLETTLNSANIIKEINI